MAARYRTCSVCDIREIRLPPRVIRIDQLSLSRRGGRAGGAFKIKDFTFFVFIAGLKVNFFSTAFFWGRRRPYKGRYAGNAKEPWKGARKNGRRFHRVTMDRRSTRDTKIVLLGSTGAWKFPSGAGHITLRTLYIPRIDRAIWQACSRDLS